MNEWQICGLIVLAWANGVFFGWIRWRKPQLDEAIKSILKEKNNGI